ncbi:MAG TPA: exodeoxyribonuclease III [Flavobacteriales bacterium]|nr:exodeoxyribonuclease III [Flavobacteriales bacterium]HRN37821.1 exodeoxyribonuclease III [Flavobacteriales bacterium]HRO39553.1 exodeoxyribonuclease III [Flavobacteriales bacterium]HRP81792.1 exodeoxyribonuclease III [Flavobacteriales bacterium]HRQ86468.1 exodeoxyribonuclease III [Flavobacteriales bacterium]
MKLISFNVNGIRAAVGKGFIESMRAVDADIICLQETKATPQQVADALAGLGGYTIHAHSAEKAGYSGTAVLSRQKPERVDLGIGIAEHDTEGRVITATFADHIVVCAYVPNSGEGLKRLSYRQQWDKDLRQYLVKLAAGKRPVIFTGDLNVAHQPIDIARPKTNYNKTAGYTQAEIDGMSALMDAGFTDTFRHRHPDEVKYSWWSFRMNARARNVGWRIDYVLVSRGFEKKVKEAFILNEIMGSDHCPVGVTW